MAYGLAGCGLFFLLQRGILERFRRGCRGQGVEKGRVNLFDEGEFVFLELLLDLGERFFAEVAVLEHLGFGLHRKVAQGGDVGVVEAVCRADAQLDLVDAGVEQLARGFAILVLGLGVLLKLESLIVDPGEDV